MEPKLNGNRLLKSQEYWIKMSVKLPPKEKTVQRENVKKNQEFNNSCP
jgi:hypothetical protein